MHKLKYMSEQKIITGVIERIIFKSPDTDFHILNIEIPDKDNIVIKINQPNLAEKITYEFKGEWETNSKFGKQFKSNHAKEILPCTKKGLKAYLQSSFFPGIGSVIANKVIEYFGDDVIKMLNEDSTQLLKVSGISKKKLKAIQDSWDKNKEINDVMAFLQSFGISTLYASKILEFYKSKCVSQIMTNPYGIINCIKGIGFKVADSIAIKAGFKEDGDERILAAINYILSDDMMGGHCYLTHAQIIENTEKLLNIKNEEKISSTINYLCKKNTIKVLETFVDKRYYSKEIYYSELYVANKILEMKDIKINNNKKIINEWKNDLKKSEIQLSEEQINGILGSINNGISVLTGAAGCGKTTTLLGLIKLLEKLNVDFKLCSPTGRAALRITETSGYQASTIHRLLGYKPDIGFTHNEYNKLDCKFLIIDEFSMVSIDLFANVLMAIDSNCRLLLVGDYQQLQSIQSGCPFKDLILSNEVYVNKLTKIYRQKEQSDIIKFAHNIIKGIVPKIKSPLEEPDLWNNSDCLFIESGEFDNNKTKKDYPKWTSQYYGYDTIGMLKKIYFDIIPKYYGDVKIQIVSPMNRGLLGTENLNTIIQEIANPYSIDKPQIQIGNRVFRKLDVVLQIINDYEKNVFNGELGVIKEINASEKSMLIEFRGEGSAIKYKKNDLLNLRNGLVISCHKMQGGEAPIVIALLTPHHTPLLYRSLLYTLITRASNKCIILGSRTSLEYAVKNIKEDNRQTSLQELLKEKCPIN